MGDTQEADDRDINMKRERERNYYLLPFVLSCNSFSVALNEIRLVELQNYESQQYSVVFLPLISIINSCYLQA